MIEKGSRVVIKNYPHGPTRERILNKQGSVISAGIRFIEVRMDDPTEGIMIFFRDELQPVNLTRLIVITVDEAQKTAVALGKMLDVVSLNNVYYALAGKYDCSIEDIDLPSEAVFRGEHWIKTKSKIKAARQSARGRKLSIWKYNPPKDYMIEVSIRYKREGRYIWTDFAPSKNSAVLGKTFNNLKDANKAMAEQQKGLSKKDFHYRVSQV